MDILPDISTLIIIILTSVCAYQYVHADRIERARIGLKEPSNRTVLKMDTSKESAAEAMVNSVAFCAILVSAVCLVAHLFIFFSKI